MKFEGKELSHLGLNLQAVINLKDLPPELNNQLALTSEKFNQYSQLILIGHAGQKLWQKLKRWQELNLSSKTSEDPIDCFSKYHVEKYFNDRLNADDFEIIFPLSKPAQNTQQSFLNLQEIGQLVGWHHPSPFGVGINQQWGSWFAYRAVVLSKSDFQPTKPLNAMSPCQNCEKKPCIQACPADALDRESLNLDLCLSYRRKENSSCQERCIARMSCPVAKEHQYDLQQIKYLTFRTKLYFHKQSHLNMQPEYIFSQYISLDFSLRHTPRYHRRHSKVS